MKLAIVGLVLTIFTPVAFSRPLMQIRKPPKQAAKQSAQTGGLEKPDRVNSPAGLALQLDQANRSFTYRDKPINPRALMELIETFSDGAIGPVAIDLSGTYKSDRYYGEYQTQSDGSVFIDLKTADPYAKEEGYITYKRLGTLKGNLHVIEIRDTTRLRQVSRELLLIRFNIDYEYDENGSRRHRLVMQRLGAIFLGEELSGQVTVQIRNNSIRISGKSGYSKPLPEKVIVIK